MEEANVTEIDRNFDYFRRNLSTFINKQRGRFALLRDSHVEGFFDRAFEALANGNSRFPDARFSIQEVTDEVSDLGYWSHAFDRG